VMKGSKAVETLGATLIEMHNNGFLILPVTNYTQSFEADKQVGGHRLFIYFFPSPQRPSGPGGHPVSPLQEYHTETSHSYFQTTLLNDYTLHETSVLRVTSYHFEISSCLLGGLRGLWHLSRKRFVFNLHGSWSTLLLQTTFPPERLRR